MTFEEFCGGGPCLEEIDGFRAQRIEDGLWSPDDQAAFLIRQDRLMRGKEVPASSRLYRNFEYQRGKKPKQKREVLR